MLRSILIGLDGSEDGNTATELGLSWAKEHDASVIGIAIVDEPGILVSEQAMFAAGYPCAITEPLVDIARQRSSVTLEKFASRCHELNVHCRALNQIGTPYVHLLDEAQKCDLIVLGQRTHFEYGWREETDETLSRVLRESPRPVVAVPRSAIEGESVVVAYDGSLQASRALYAFQASGLARSKTVYVVSVNPIRATAARHANRAVEFLRIHDRDVIDVVAETHQNPDEVILYELVRRKAGLLVMGAYGQPTFREFFIGSVTRKILEKSHSRRLLRSLI